MSSTSYLTHSNDVFRYTRESSGARLSSNASGKIRRTGTAPLPSRHPISPAIRLVHQQQSLPLLFDFRELVLHPRISPGLCLAGEFGSGFHCRRGGKRCSMTPTHYTKASSSCVTRVPSSNSMAISSIHTTNVVFRTLNSRTPQ